MNIAHKDLAAGRWVQLSFCEQMAHIGSEVSRALNWKKKDNALYCQKAFNRACELLSFTIDAVTVPVRYKELTRLREAMNDYFLGDNQCASTGIILAQIF